MVLAPHSSAQKASGYTLPGYPGITRPTLSCFLTNHPSIDVRNIPRSVVCGCSRTLSRTEDSGNVELHGLDNPSKTRIVMSFIKSFAQPNPPEPLMCGVDVASGFPDGRLGKLLRGVLRLFARRAARLLGTLRIIRTNRFLLEFSRSIDSF